MKRKLKKIQEYTYVYGIGAAIYCLIEIVWRGFTHWTMGVAGGACFVGIYLTNSLLPNLKMWKKCAIGTGIITFVEFVVGCIVNKILHWNVWDYSDMVLNLFGQVCLLYSAIWFVLSAPATMICSALKKRLFSKNFFL